MVVAQTGNNLAIIFTSSTLVTVHNFHGFATDPEVVLTKSSSATIAALSRHLQEEKTGQMSKMKVNGLNCAKRRLFNKTCYTTSPFLNLYICGAMNF